MGTWKLPEESDLPDEVGRYVLHGILGQGGMARVYRAELLGPAGFRKMVALKIVLPEGLDAKHSEETAFLVREARLGGMLRHPHIVDIYELGTVEGVPFISMELVDGPTLSDLISSRGALPPPIAIQFGLQLAEALCVAHNLDTGHAKRGVVHRDLKPGNILIDPNGLAKIADFGLADLTSQLQSPSGGQVFGTPAYMSPEQLRGSALDPRSDQYSFGSLFYEMLTGERLYESDDYRRTASLILDSGGSHRKRAVARLNTVVPDSGGVLWRCLQPLPNERYADTESLAEALRLLERRPVWPIQIKRWLEDPHDLSLEDNVSDDPVPVPAQRSTMVLPEDLNQELVKATQPTSCALPDEPNFFVGRIQDLVWMRKHLNAGSRLVTVKGPGGMGKTRLCIHFATAHAADFDGGIIWVELSEARTEEDVIDMVGRVLGVNSEGEPDAIDHLGRILEGRGRSLLMLDTCDRIGNPLAHILVRWFAMAPELQVVVTSRERLRIQDEKIVDLAPLVEADGVQLFMDRANDALGRVDGAAGFDMDQVRRLVKRLESMPLTIELAAARMATLTLGELNERLNKRFDVLQSDGHSHDRAATLRGTIDWSWQLLEPWEQSALAQLSVCRGGFRFEDAVSFVKLPADAPWVMDVIGALYDKSLLRSWTVGTTPRFGMYAAIHEYATGKLQEQGPSFENDVADRHAAAFAAKGHAEALRTLEQASHDPINDEIRLERANLRAALSHAVQQGATGDAVSLGHMFSLMLSSEGRYEPCLSVLDEVLAMDDISDVQRAELMALYVGAETMAARPDLIASSEAYMALADSVGVLRLRVRSKILHGRNVRLCQGPAESRPVLMEALELAMDLASPYEWASSEGLLAGIELDLGNPERAARLFRRARDRYALAGLDQWSARCQMSLANLMRVQGKHEEACQQLQIVLALARQMGDRRMEGNGLRLLGGVLDSLGRTEDAIEVLEAAMTIQRGLGSRIATASNHYALAAILIHCDQAKRAHDLVEWTIEVARETNNVGLLGGCLGIKGLAAAMMGRAPESKAAFAEAKAVLEPFGIQWVFGRLYCRWAEAVWLLGDEVGAQKHLETAWRIGRENKVGPQSILAQSIAHVEGLMARR